jgi:hypothetical protein
VVSSKLLVAQDLVKKSVVVNSSVSLEVDLSRLVMPPTTLASSKWQVEWGQGKLWQKGSQLSNTYTKTGSYLITLQESDPLTRGFQNYDLIQINVVPKSSYSLPNVAVTANSSKDSSGNLHIAFSSLANTDASSLVREIQWDFGDGEESSGTEVTHIYKPFVDTMFVTVRIVDGNGIFNDTSWKLNVNGDLIRYNENYSGIAVGPVKGWYSNAWFVVVGVIAALIVPVSGLVLLRKFRVQ